MPGQSSARSLLAVIACGFLIPTVPLARAFGSTAEPVLSASQRDPERLRATAAVGGAIGGIGGYQGYGIGLLARAGIEVPLFELGGMRNALMVAAEGGRFSAWAIDTPFLFRGVQLDLASLRTNWRLYPWPGQGLYLDAGGGLTLARDRIDMQLPGRDVKSTQLRLGVPIEFGLGWVLAQHLDVSLRYSQIVFTTQEPASFGFMQLALGVRL
jgi:hypothetical protein